MARGVALALALAMLGYAEPQIIPTKPPPLADPHHSQAGRTNDDFRNTIRYDGRDRGQPAPPRALGYDMREQPPLFHPGRGVWKGEVPLDRSTFRDWHGAAQQTTPMGYQYAAHAPHAMEPLMRASRPKEDFAVWFDGVAQHGRVWDAVDLQGESFSVEAWVKRTRTGFAESVISHGSSRRDMGFRLGFTRTNRARFAFSDEDNGTCADSLGTWESDVEMGGPQWHHWAATFNAETLEAAVYRDGVQVLGALRPAAKNANVGPFFPCKKYGEYTGEGPLFVARSPPGVTPYKEYFRGGIDEVRVWRGRAISRRDVRTFMFFAHGTTVPHHPSGDLLHDYFHFNEGRGAEAVNVARGGVQEPMELLLSTTWVHGLYTKEVAVEDAASSVRMDEWLWTHETGEREETNYRTDRRGGRTYQGPQLYDYVPLPYADHGANFYGLVDGLEPERDPWLS